MANLGYKNGVLKFFDIGGHPTPAPTIPDNEVINLPESEELTEDYPRDKADGVAERIATKLGLPTPQYVGAGSLGVAYDIGDNKILKITKDNSEAYENLKMIGQNLKYIAQPYRVFEVDSETPLLEARKTYAIILEKLEQDKESLKRSYERLDYAFKNIFKTNIKEAVDSYLHGYEYDDEPIDKKQVDNYFKKNPKDGEFFFGLVRIAEELQSLGIESYDYFNTENLGYKPNGALGFFDVGFTDGFAVPDGAEEINVEEDGSAKFSTDDAMGQDGFPTYDNTADSSPSINNSLDANVAMYEDLEYNHVDGDATEDEYELSEEVIPYSEEGNDDDDYDYDKIYSQAWEVAKASGINILSNKQLTGFVLKDNKVVGAIFSSLDNNEKEFSFDVVVDQRYRGSGIGRELTQNGIDQYEFYRDMFEEDDLKLVLDVVNPNMRELLKKYFNFNDIQKVGTDRYLMTMTEERKKAWMTGSKAVTVKKKCQLGGNGDGTSTACNQGDINNLEFSKINEVGEGNLEPYDVSIEKSIPSVKAYVFTTEDGDEYRIEFGREGLDNNLWDVNFKTLTRFGEPATQFTDVVNKGRMYRVMATLLKVMKGFFANTNPDMLVIEPTKTKNEYDDRRFLLYLSYIKKHLPVEYEMTQDKKEILIKKKGLDEYFSSLVPQINEKKITKKEFIKYSSLEEGEHSISDNIKEARMMKS
jgi:ribosomal protein S18 acetylase RimI-like enzyme